LSDISDNGYLAVIHADGNRVGIRHNQWMRRREAPTEGSVDREAYREQFFHSMRVAVRQAVIAALSHTFASFNGRQMPYQLLMLGGDDLLLVCQARYALPFVSHYAKQLEARPLVDGIPLTIGAGVAIARVHFPFYRLHSLAEALASSAKRLHRQALEHAQAQVSVADWLVITQAWSDDPSLMRRRSALQRYPREAGMEYLALSDRPYRILSDGSDGLESLEGLLEAAEQLRSSHAARSQLRRLVEELPKGRLWGDLCFSELSSPTKTALQSIGMHQPWIPVNSDDQEGSLWKTRLLDLVEIVEIERLGKREPTRPASASATGSG
jgi:hypothetical protein